MVMGPKWGPSGADRTQVGLMLASWTLLSGDVSLVSSKSDQNFTFQIVVLCAISFCIVQQYIASLYVFCLGRWWNGIGIEHLYSGGSGGWYCILPVHSESNYSGLSAVLFATKCHAIWTYKLEATWCGQTSVFITRNSHIIRAGNWCFIPSE